MVSSIHCCQMNWMGRVKFSEKEGEGKRKRKREEKEES